MIHYRWKKDGKLNIGHIEYIYEVKINNRTEFFLQLKAFKITKTKVIIFKFELKMKRDAIISATPMNQK